MRDGPRGGGACLRAALTRCELLELDRPTPDQITKTLPHVGNVLREFAEKREANARRLGE